MKKVLLFGVLICSALCVSAQKDGKDKKQLKAEQVRLDSINGAGARECLESRVWFFNAVKMNALKSSASGTVNPVLKQNYTPELATSSSCFVQAGGNGLMQTDYFVRNSDEYYYMTEGEFRGTITDEVYKTDKKGKVFYSCNLNVSPSLVIPCILRLNPGTNEGEMTFEFTEHNFKIQLKGTVQKYEPKQ